MSTVEQRPLYRLLRSSELLAPDRKWAPKILLPGEIPIPIILLRDPQFFTTAFAQTVAQSAIRRLPQDLETIQKTLGKKARIRVEDDILKHNGAQLDPKELSLSVENSGEGSTLAFSHYQTGIRLDTRPRRKTVATIPNDHPLSAERWEQYGWESKTGTQRWHEEKVIFWNAFLRLLYRNLAIGFTNEGLEKLERQGRIQLDYSET